MPQQSVLAVVSSTQDLLESGQRLRLGQKNRMHMYSGTVWWVIWLWDLGFLHRKDF